MVYRIVEKAEWPILTTGLRVGSRNPGGGNHGQSSMWSEDKIGSDHFLSLHLHLRAKYEGEIGSAWVTHPAFSRGRPRHFDSQSHWAVSSAKSGCHYQKEKWILDGQKQLMSPLKRACYKQTKMH